MSEIKAIPTAYAGYRMRSRMEARWAILFDEMGIEWEYEREGFELPSGLYLPDFYFPKTRTYAEVKAKDLNNDEWLKIMDLCRMSGCPVFALVGPPAVRQYDMYLLPNKDKPENIVKMSSRFYRSADEEKYRKAVNVSRSARFEHGEHGVPSPAKPRSSVVFDAPVPDIMPRSEIIRIFNEEKARDLTPAELAVSVIVPEIKQVQQVWSRFLTDTGKITKQSEVMLSKAYPTHIDDGKVIITFSEKYHFERMNEPSKLQFLGKLMSRCLGIEGVEVDLIFDASVPVLPVNVGPKKALKRDPLAELLALDTIPEIAPAPSGDSFGGGSWDSRSKNGYNVPPIRKTLS